jgi:hypothetical protein
MKVMPQVMQAMKKAAPAAAKHEAPAAKAAVHAAPHPPAGAGKKLDKHA